ncbi:RepA leader peptide Tap [Escherichia coli]|nr:RepA leader peptide Tap [Escherichia coli]
MPGKVQDFFLCSLLLRIVSAGWGTVAKLAMRQPFVLFKGLTFQKLCLPGAFRPGDHHNKMLRPGLCVVHASPQYL